jgi:hypothetical protein
MNKRIFCTCSCSIFSCRRCRNPCLGLGVSLYGFMMIFYVSNRLLFDVCRLGLSFWLMSQLRTGINYILFLVTIFLVWILLLVTIFLVWILLLVTIFLVWILFFIKHLATIFYWCSIARVFSSINPINSIIKCQFVSITIIL